MARLREERRPSLAAELCCTRRQDDCIVVLDNPTDVVITASSWLVGGWNSNGGIVLRAVQGHGAPRPALHGLHVTDSYIRRMPSFPKEPKKTQFVLFDENQGKFNFSLLVDVVLAHDRARECFKRRLHHFARSTRALLTFCTIVCL